MFSKLHHYNRARINRFLVAVLFAGYLSFLLISLLVGRPPYDYFLTMQGTVDYCLHQNIFRYGLEQNNYYPAPFYVAFCLPMRYAEPLLRSIFVLLPPLLALWMARGRAWVLLYPPLLALIHIGQSSWLLLPMYLATAQVQSRREIPPWLGLIFLPAMFKPHIAFPAALWLLFHWRGQARLWFVALVGALSLIMPAFLLRPTWVQEWLSNTRPLEQTVTSIAAIPIRLGYENNLLFVLGFCAGVALLLYALLRQRRGKLAAYDWMLLYFFCSPFIIYYDLYLLLPFIAPYRRRLLLAMTAGSIALLFAFMSAFRWEMCIAITMALLMERILRLKDDPAR